MFASLPLRERVASELGAQIKRMIKEEKKQKNHRN